eukprot:3346689-Pyramimonas_sp.AAC.1
MEHRIPRRSITQQSNAAEYNGKKAVATERRRLINRDACAEAKLARVSKRKRSTDRSNDVSNVTGVTA